MTIYRVPRVAAVGVCAFFSVAAHAAAPPCGDTNYSGTIGVADALVALQSSVSLRLCDPCRGDVSGDGTISAEDALRILRRSVGLYDEGDHCPACVEPVCGDGVLAAYQGQPFRNLDLGDCDVLDTGPGDSWNGGVEVKKALDANLQDVTEQVSIDGYNIGCFCWSSPRTKPSDPPVTRRRSGARHSSVAVSERVSASTSWSTTSTTSTGSPTTSLSCSDCMFDVYSETDRWLAVLELDVGEMCWFDVKPPLVGEEDRGSYRVHSKVIEECDDGNTRDGDGCSSTCQVEKPE